jgi:hypothetical protein
MTLRIISIRCLMIRGTVCLRFRIRTSLTTLKNCGNAPLQTSYFKTVCETKMNNLSL